MKLLKANLLIAAALLLDSFDLQAHAISNTANAFDIHSPYNQMTRYLRRGRSGATAAAIDLTVTPAFNALGAPAGSAAVGSTTGGTLAAATYYYRVSALNANGETLAAAEVNGVVASGTTGSVAVSWTAKTGATGYNIYGRTTGAETLLATVGAVATWTDTGANTPQGAGFGVPTADTTGVITGALPGQINAGDMVYRTANGGIASLNTPGVANANAASFLGVSEENYPLNIGLGEGLVIGRPLNDTTSVAIAVRQSGEFKFKTTPGDVYAPGAAVYLGLDAQTVTVTSSGSSVGRVCNDQNVVGGGDFSATITGAAGQEVVIEITPPAAY